jgi:putative peptidoglycan lipid II flippase
MELPQGVFGISLATYLLPTLSGLAAEKKYDDFRATLRSGISTLLFFNLIAAVLLVVLAEPIVRLLFERGQFNGEATGRAAFALICLAPGLVAFSTVNVLARAFYALGDTKTPMQIGVACLLLNLILAIALVHPLRQGGLGVANTLTSLANMGLLLFLLRKKLGRLELSFLRAALLPLALAAALASGVAYLGAREWEASFGHATLGLKVGAVFGPASAAAFIYWLAAVAFKIPAAQEMTALMRRKQI